MQLLAEVRREHLLDIVNERQNISTEELSHLLHVSCVTIRSDLAVMEKLGKIRKVHGGAISTQMQMDREIPITEKAKLNMAAKCTIAELALPYVREGDVVILDAGTTTYQLALLLKDMDVTVATNDINIGHLLAGEGKGRLILSGGVAMRNVQTLKGSVAVNFFQSIQADTVFLGCDAVDWEFGISNRSLEEVAVKRAMLRAAKKVIALTDHSKFYQMGLARVCTLHELDLLITDHLSEEEKIRCKKKKLSFLTKEVSPIEEMIP